MRACVIHNTLNTLGGGKRVALEVVRLLKEMGFRVRLVTFDRTDWSLVARGYGAGIPLPDEEKYLFSSRIPILGIYTRILIPPTMLKGCDLTINTHGDFMLARTDITYMHYPTFVLAGRREYSKYSRSLLWRAYFTPYQLSQQLLARLVTHGVIVTNSRFSREAIRRHLKVNSVIVYPPVDLGEFLKAASNIERDDTVVLCGRYSPEKNYELALAVAERLPHVEFVIIGAASGKVSGPYYEKLRRIVERKGLRNVKLLRDVPRVEQIKLYSKAKVYMHAMVNEHFGIAVVEGMAAGLVPVVHKSGGPWLDIIAEGRYGYGYNSIEEAVESIEKALDSYDTMRWIVIERAKMFAPEVFRRRMRVIVEKVLSLTHAY